MRPTPRLALLSVLVALVSFTLACGLPFQPSGAAPAGTPPAAANHGAGNPQPEGDRLLADPAAGLANLPGYHVSFQQDVTGWLDGQAYERRTHLELTRSGGGVDFVRELQGGAGAASYFRAIGLDRAVYRWRSADQTCQGSAGDPPTGEMLEPATLLLPIHGASREGSETVNQIQAVHYRFDQNSLSLAEPKESVTGDVWVAETGGYVVKYTLAAAASATPSGKGLETGQLWTYNLSLVGETGAVVLPETCIEVPLDLPLYPGAQAETYSSGWLEFTTPAAAVQVVNFYLQKLPELGWTAPQKELAAEPGLPFAVAFTRKDELLALNIDQGEPDGLEITLFLYNPQLMDQPADEPVAPPQPTVDPAASGLAEDVPLYPGATGLLRQGETVMFNVADSPAAVAKFYAREMAASGWALQSQNAAADTTIQIWQKTDRTLSIVVGATGGSTYVAMTPIESH